MNEDEMMRAILAIESPELPPKVGEVYFSLKKRLADEGKWMESPRHGSLGVPYRLWTPELRADLSDVPGVYVCVDEAELETALMNCAGTVKNLLVNTVKDEHLDLIGKFPALEGLDLRGSVAHGKRWYVPSLYPLFKG